MFQMTFAIITPALIIGAIVERIRFQALLIFVALWMFLVYAPVAHWVWGGGWLASLGVLDFAGGLVVHVTAGASALVLALLLGPRSGFPNDVKLPHAPWMSVTGAAMLWVGWFGFNAGSALAAGGNAGMAMTATHLSAAIAGLTWMTIEWLKYGRPSMVGMITGAIAGLATITPASGFVGPGAALIIGVVASSVCFACVSLVKRRLQIDDSLDVFAVHGVGGATGIVLTGVFVDAAFGGIGHHMTIVGHVGVQLIGLVATFCWSAVVTFLLATGLQATFGLRVSEEDELKGLDITAHGESGYNV